MPLSREIDPDRVIAAVANDEYIGFCKYCGAESDGVEPDARNYPCDECGQSQVFGAEELLLDIC